jgi:hypothetical protein
MKVEENTKRRGLKFLAILIGLAVGFLMFGYLVPRWFSGSDRLAKVEVDWQLLG